MCASAELQRFGDFVDDAVHGLARVVRTALPDRLGDGVVCVEGFRLGLLRVHVQFDASGEHGGDDGG